MWKKKKFVTFFFFQSQFQTAFHCTEFSLHSGIFKLQLIKVQQWGCKKVALLSTITAKYFCVTNQPIKIYFHVNKYQISNLVFIEYLQKVTDQSNTGLFSKSQIQLDMESINALSRVAQAQQQQECFNLSSKVNDTVYAAPPKGNRSVTTTRYIT